MKKAEINAVNPQHKKEKILQENSTHKAVLNGNMIDIIIKGFTIDDMTYPDDLLYSIRKDEQDDLQSIFDTFDETNRINRAEANEAFAGMSEQSIQALIDWANKVDPDEELIPPVGQQPPVITEADEQINAAGPDVISSREELAKESQFKTILPESITSLSVAKKLLTDLHINGESYHPEDPAFDCIGHIASKEQCDHLDKLMNEIYEWPGNENFQKMVFDPCEFLMALDASDDLKNFHYFENIPIGSFVNMKKLLINAGHKLKDVFKSDFKSSLLSSEKITIYFTSKITGFDFAAAIADYKPL